MKCKQANVLLSQYLDDELAPDQAKEMRDHLESCPACAADASRLERALASMEAEGCAERANPTAEELEMIARFQQRLAAQGSATATRPAHAFGSTLRYALAVAGMIALVFFFLARQSHSSAALADVLAALRHPIVGPVHIVEASTGHGPNWSGGTITTDKYAKDGAVFQETRSSEGRKEASVGPGGELVFHPTDKKVHGYTLFLPNNIHYEWEEGDATLRLYWDASWDRGQRPERRDVTGLEHMAGSLQHLLSYLDAGGKAQNIEVETTTETIDNESYRRLSLQLPPVGIPQTQSKPQGIAPLPQTLTVWLDANGRVRRYRTAFKEDTATGGTAAWQMDVQIEYNVTPPAHTFEPPLKQGMQVTLGGQIPINLAQVVEPVWETMTDAEKAKVQAAVDRFASAWGAKDFKTLQQAVDCTWPLELASPQARVGWTPERVWERNWKARLYNEPLWRNFGMKIVYAVRKNGSNSDQVAVEDWQNRPNAPLPGLNVFALASQAGRDGGTPVRLFLVKRGQEWKVFQYYRQESPIQ